MHVLQFCTCNDDNSTYMIGFWGCRTQIIIIIINEFHRDASLTTSSSAIAERPRCMVG